MKVLSLGGAGAVCSHATRDLVEFSDFDQIIIGDYNVTAAEKLAAEYDRRIRTIKDIIQKMVTQILQIFMEK